MDEETARIIGRMQRELETLRAIEISPIANSGWVATSVTWTYASASTFTVSGDVTVTYQKGTFLRWKQGGGWKYGVVASSAYAAPNTTVTIIVNTDYTIANAAITDPWYSYAANPQGWPNWFNYTPTVTSQTGSITSATATGMYLVLGHKITIRIQVDITNNGSGGGSVYATLPIAPDQIYCILAGREVAGTGVMLQGIANGPLLDIYTYNNAYPGGTGYVLLVGGPYDF